MKNIKTIIKFPLCRGYDFPCVIEITSKYESGTPSEFELQNRWLVNGIAKYISENNADIKDIQISQEIGE